MELVCKQLYICLLLVLIIGCKEKNITYERPTLSNQTSNGITVPKDSTKLIPSQGLVYYKNTPFTGTSTVHHSNGNLVESMTYQSGKRNGYFKKWFDDGTASFESIYVDGKRHGKAMSWWRDGNLRSESNYEYSIAHGLQKQWYQNGSKFKEINLNQGKEEGMQKSWRENGKLYNNYEAKNGRIFGLKRANLCFSLDDETVVYEK